MDDNTKKDLQNKILQKLNELGTIENSETLESELNIDHDKLESLLKSLVVDFYIDLKPIKRKELKLTEEGEECLEKGTPEFRIFQLLEPGVETEKDAFQQKHGIEINKQLVSKLKLNGWVDMGKSSVTRKEGVSAEDKDVDTLKEMVENPDPEKHDQKKLKELKNRKFVKLANITNYTITKGTDFAPEVIERESELTVDLLKNDEYKNKIFKKFNTLANGAEIDGGHLHPLLKVRTLVKDIFFEWDLRKCLLVNTLKVHSGTSMLCSSPSNIQPETPMILSSLLNQKNVIRFQKIIWKESRRPMKKEGMAQSDMITIGVLKKVGRTS